MKNTAHFLLFLFITIFFFVACKKGDQGLPGTTGNTGPAGPQGPQGPIGNANVLTDTFSVYNADWVYNSAFYIGGAPGVSDGYFTKYYDRTFPSITSDVLATGAILVYFASTPDLNRDQWVPLNFSMTINGYNFNYVYETSIGMIRLHIFFSKVTVDPPNIDTYTFPTYRYKIVVIKSNVALKMGSDKVKELKLMSYKDACASLHIPE
jgi:hypothetical protein